MALPLSSSWCDSQISPCYQPWKQVCGPPGTMWTQGSGCSSARVSWELGVSSVGPREAPTSLVWRRETIPLGGERQAPHPCENPAYPGAYLSWGHSLSSPSPTDGVREVTVPAPQHPPKLGEHVSGRMLAFFFWMQVYNFPVAVVPNHPNSMA